jgi:Protein of unknown function (DUF416)
MRNFDRAQLVARLSKLPKHASMAFAAAAATRLLPCVYRVWTTNREDGALRLRAAIEALWKHIEGDLQSSETLRRHALTADELAGMERADAHFRSPYSVCAENAASAVSHAYCSLLRSDVEEAAWAAYVAFEAIELFAFRTRPPRVDDPKQHVRIRLQNPLVQAELARQERDLTELESASLEHLKTTISSIHRRSEAQPVISLTESDS